MLELVKVPHKLPDDFERLAIITVITGTIAKFALEDDQLTDLSLTFTEIETNLTKAVGHEERKPITQLIKDAHTTRLSCVGTFYRGILFYKDHPSEELRNAANALSDIYEEHFGNLPDKKRVTYTYAVKQFLKDLEPPVAKGAAEKLTLAETITKLATSQESLISLTARRIEQEEKDDTPLLKEARDEMHDIYDVLERHLFYMSYKKKIGYEELINELNGGISEILVTAKSRHTHEQNEEEQERENEEPSLEDLQDELHENPGDGE